MSRVFTKYVLFFAITLFLSVSCSSPAEVDDITIEADSLIKVEEADEPVATNTPEPIDTAEPTETPEPTTTPTAEPTDTPEPTATTQPTNTPRPTNTTAPTNTPVPTNPPATNTPIPPTVVPSNTPVPLPTNTPIPPTEPPPPTAVPAPTEPPAPAAAQVVIIGVNKQDEYVDIQNLGGTAQDLGGWMLRSEKGNQDCYLSGVIEAGAVLRIWAMSEDAGQGGFNCGFGSNIWNNSESDPAVLYDNNGVEVSRR